MDQGTLKVILFFNSLLASSKNKEYLMPVCKEFLSEHFGENCMTL